MPTIDDRIAQLKYNHHKRIIKENLAMIYEALKNYSFTSTNKDKPQLIRSALETTKLDPVNDKDILQIKPYDKKRVKDFIERCYYATNRNFCL